jgi:signal transduction histidine kinase
VDLEVSGKVMQPSDGRAAGRRGDADAEAILLVDDQEANLLAMGEVLRGLGAEVVCARSGAEALRLLLDRDFALLLLDVEMPGLGGFEVAKLVRARDVTQQTPILFVTAHLATDEAVQHGYALGAVDFVIKPVAPEVLRAKVIVFVELQRRRREEERARRLLQRANADLTRFAQAAAHDLQAPLRGIADLLKRLEGRAAAAGDDESRALASRAIAEASRMRTLVRGLLDYALVRAQLPAPESVDASALLEEALLVLRSAVEASGAQVTRDPLPQVRADATLVKQVFQNLLENAIKFRGSKPPRVHVGGACEDGWCTFSVRDEGIGIRSQDCSRLFEPLRRLQPRSAYDGTGLGLAICREIVERHGGRIWVESDEGRGSTFRFTLPAAGTAATA